MSDRLLALRLFARIARTGSFSRAGRELGLSQPSASRIASELERQVGAALMTRTTRGLTLTEAGSDYLARIEPILAALEEADHAARGTGELRGTCASRCHWVSGCGK
jgi:DNA-binding transcriptional LysR family regulator